MEEKKKKLRQKALSQRKLLPIGIKREKSKKIVDSIINSDEYKTNNVFFAYAALEDEVNIDEFIIQALADNKKVFLRLIRYQTNSALFCLYCKIFYSMSKKRGFNGTKRKNNVINGR